MRILKALCLLSIFVGLSTSTQAEFVSPEAQWLAKIAERLIVINKDESAEVAESSEDFRSLMMSASEAPTEDDIKQLRVTADKLGVSMAALRSDRFRSRAIRTIAEYLSVTGSSNREAIAHLASGLIPALVIANKEVSMARLEALMTIGRRVPIMTLLEVRFLISQLKGKSEYALIVERASQLLQSQWPHRKVVLSCAALLNKGVTAMMPAPWR